MLKNPMKKVSRKCIYGLKQAPRAWNEKFTPALLEFGLCQSKSDPCLFFRRQQGESLIVIIYVNDTIVFHNNKTSFTKLANHLKQHYEIRILPATSFVGVDIVRDPVNNRIFLHQSSYATRPDMAQALNVLARFSEDPQNVHVTAAKHLLAYLKGTTTYGFCFDANQPDNLL